MNWRVPLADIDFGVEEEEAVLKVIRSRWLSMGETTREFENAFAAFMDAKHAIAVTNATSALHLACIACGVQNGDEVILPSLTFVATANAIRYTGATPVFADIVGLGDLNISPASIASRITPKTKAILVVHYAGYPCDMPAIMDIARQNQLMIIEDAAHAVGASLDGQSMGNWGKIGCFSFFSNKNMTSGEGGMVVTKDGDIANRIRILRSHGMTSLSWDRHQGHAASYDVVDLGYNYRIDEIRSAIGLVQLQKLPDGNRRRGELTGLYRELLGKYSPEILVPFMNYRGTSSHHLMPILLPEKIDRSVFMDDLKKSGIQTSIHYPPVHTFQIYQEEWIKRNEDLPYTDVVAAREVTLPLFATMRKEQVEWVIQAVREAIDKVNK
jgi:dTDP-4-amino-4,6-dideoxygalactose transaminase